MKKIVYSLYMLGAAALCTTAVSCSEDLTELKEVSYDRLFSPVGLEVRVKQQVNANVTWDAVKNATDYTLELYSGKSVEEGTLVQTQTATTTSYVFTKLDGAESYAVRVKANGTDIPESRWVEATFKTDAEQILDDVDMNLLAATSVTLTWPAGETVDQIVLTPGDITHNLTSSEIAAGKATIEKLASETAYTATILRGGKERGSVSFTTLVDLGGAVAVYPEDDLAAKIAEASDGATLALFPGEYSVGRSPEDDTKYAKIVIEKSISITAVRPNDRPTVHGCFQLYSGASLSLNQVIVDGSETDGSQAFDYKDAGDYGTLSLIDCEVKNYGKGFYYVNVAAAIQSIVIDKCLIHNITCSGGDMFDCRKGGIKSLAITNSTIYDSCEGRDIVRYDKTTVVSNPTVKIDRCTFSGVQLKRIFYVRVVGNSCTFTNNIVANVADTSLFSVTDSVLSEVSGNYYFNAASVAASDGGAKTLETNPFKDAANGDFTIVNEDVNYYKVGDPRWLQAL